jgi:UDP-galactose transporter
MQQSKVFFTAFFSRLMLGRILSTQKWAVLLVLVLSIAILSLEATPTPNSSPPTEPGAAEAAAIGSYAVGLIAVTADAALSGLATVYFEKVLKTTALTVWDRNTQLATWSLLIYVPWALAETSGSPLTGWSGVTLTLALLGAFGGILVALVIKHADGLAKNLATGSSIVLTTAAGYLLFGGPMNLQIGLASLIVIVAGYLYQKVP